MTSPQQESLRYFIEISYHGRAYHGWQIQQNANTVQYEVNKALTTMCGFPIDTVGSGRTDTGVHAIQQFCHLDLKDHWDVREAKHQLNALLPVDIAVKNIYPVQADAHARFSAVSRSYEYHISRLKNPFRNDISYYYRPVLAIDEMNCACRNLIGEKDFRSFSKAKTSVEHYICNLTGANWEVHNDSYCFYVSANRFLRGMVRTLVGTLLEVGTGRLTVQELREILESGDRKVAGRSVPAHGLFLTKVEYPEQLLKII